jgi:5,10-methylenetetrahydromethanopterin reductase
MVDISCALPPTPETPDLVRYAEELGYRRAWIYDTPPLQLDVWMTLALAADRTQGIGIGPGVLVPSNRHPLTTATAIAHLESLAAGRTAYAFGTGFTARHALGQPPLRWANVAEHVRTVAALLRGETVEIDGAAVAMLHGSGQAPPRPIEPPFLIGASGPKGEAVAHELGAGVISSSPVAGFAWSVWLAFGTVLGDAEDPDAERVLRSAGPGAAIAYHAAYQRRRPAFETLPGAAAWRDSIESVDPAVRHLETHRGHLTELNRHDRTVMTASIAAAVSRSGTAAQWRERIAAAAAAGTTEVAFQPAGDDLRHELRAFIEAVGSSSGDA